MGKNLPDRAKSHGQFGPKTTYKTDGQTERQRDRQTERQKHRKTETQKDRKTERQKDRKTERQKDGIDMASYSDAMTHV